MSLTQTLLRSPAVAALTSPHGVDRYLELVNPMWAAHEVRARVVRVERETFDVTTLTLHPTNTWHGFRAGQHVQLGVEIDSVRYTRCFSISSSDLREKLTGDRTFTITVRGHDEGLVSKHLARNADVGTVVHLSEAEGDFVLPVAAAPQAADDLRRLRHHPGDVDAPFADRLPLRGPHHVRALRAHPGGDDLRRGARRAGAACERRPHRRTHADGGQAAQRAAAARAAARPTWTPPRSRVARPG